MPKIIKKLGIGMLIAMTAIFPLTLKVRAASTIYDAATVENLKYPNGKLVLDEQIIYTVYRGQKISFNNSATFINLGYKWTNLFGATLNHYPSLPVSVKSANEHHPWGSWVLGGKTVYFIHESGLIPITTYKIFLNNGGQDDLILPMNWYDWQLPKLPYMSDNDPRLTPIDTQTMEVPVNTNFIIEMETNPSTGYAWTVNYNAKYIKLMSRTYMPYRDLIGSGGVEIFEFQSLQAGSTEIKFTEQRSGETLPIREEIHQIIIH